MNKNGSATVQLDAKTAEYLEKMQTESRQAQINAATQAAAPYSQRMAGALDLFVSMNGLDGKWDLSDDMKSISRVDGEPNVAQKNGRKRK